MNTRDFSSTGLIQVDPSTARDYQIFTLNTESRNVDSVRMIPVGILFLFCLLLANDDKGEQEVLFKTNEDA
jgi:hypothetical protein